MSIEDKDRETAKEYAESNTLRSPIFSKEQAICFEKCFLAGISYGRSTPSKEDIVNALKGLSDDERLEIFQNFCVHCGRLDPDGLFCQCWNDE